MCGNIYLKGSFPSFGKETVENTSNEELFATFFIVVPAWNDGAAILCISDSPLQALSACLCVELFVCMNLSTQQGKNFLRFFSVVGNHGCLLEEFSDDCLCTVDYCCSLC